MDLTAENVERLFVGCISPAGGMVDGVMCSARLDVFGHEADIESMLLSLPEEFQSDKGGGWSFLNGCMTKDGQQWTGLHAIVDRLFMLGMAAGKARYLLPRETWPNLPGGVPYIAVL